MVHNYKEKALQTLRDFPIPVDIEKVRKKAGMKSWVTSKAILLELLCEGKISGQKTTKSWIFWIETKSKRGEAR